MCEKLFFKHCLLVVPFKIYENNEKIRENALAHQQQRGTKQQKQRRTRTEFEKKRIQLNF